MISAFNSTRQNNILSISDPKELNIAQWYITLCSTNKPAKMFMIDTLKIDSESVNKTKALFR
jgi:hypothetical protein